QRQQPGDRGRPPAERVGRREGDRPRHDHDQREPPSRPLTDPLQLLHEATPSRDRATRAGPVVTIRTRSPGSRRCPAPQKALAPSRCAERVAALRSGAVPCHGTKFHIRATRESDMGRRRQVVAMAAVAGAALLAVTACSAGTGVPDSIGGEGGGGASTAETVLRVAFNQPENHPQYIALEAMGDRLRERTGGAYDRSEEHTSELQSRENLVCRLLLEKKNRQLS